MVRLAFFCWLFLLSIISVSAQEYSTKQFGIREGLPQSEVTAIAEDQLGYLWIGTGSGGIVQFDGKDFTSFSTKDGLLSNFVSDIEVDSHNNIWIAHMSGVTKFDRKHFSTFSVPDTTRQFGRIRNLLIDNDTLLVVSGTGFLGKIYKDSVYTWKYHPYIRTKGRLHSIEKTKRGSLFFLFYNGPVVIRRRDQAITTQVNFKPLATDAKFTFPRHIFSAGNKIIAGAEGDFKTVDATGSVSEARDVPSFPLYYDDASGEWWHRATRSDSVFVAGSRKSISVALPRTTTFMFKDKEGNLWAASSDKGLFKVSRKKIYLNESTSGLRVNNILKIASDEYWFGTFGQGLYRLKNDKASKLFFDQKYLRRNNITGLALSPEHEVWVTTDMGVGIFKTNGDTIRWMSRLNRYPFAPVSHVSIDENGNAWLATLNTGSIMFAKKRMKLLNAKTGNGFSDLVYTAFYSKFFRKMVLAYENHYQLADTVSATTIAVPELRNSSIVSMASFQDSLVVIGSNGAGIMIHSPKTGMKANLTKANGFVSDFVYFASEDSSGNLWVGTEKGVSRLKLTRDYKIQQHHFYETSETNQDACNLEGKPIFGTIDGIYQFSTDTTEAGESNDFPLHFTQIEANHQAITKYGLIHPSVEKLELPYNQASLSFAFNAIEKSDPDVIRYSYMLENFDADWSTPNVSRRVAYNNLDPGSYVFRARAIDMITGKTKNEISYKFVVTPPFYKTTAFIFLMVCVAMLLVVSYIWFRIRANINRLVTIEKIRSEQQAMLRKEMAQDFHDEMGNQLARIINFTSQLQLQPIASDNHRTLYKKIEDTAKNLYNGTREFIWSMNPDNERLHHVFNHVKDFGETLFADCDIRFVTDNRSKSTQSLPFGYAREITLIFKEALTNVFKYSKAKEVKLALTSTPQGFEITVSDNGVGFVLGKSAGNGLANMQNRANKMKAEFSIFTEPGKGTSISLYLDHSFHAKSSTIDRFRQELSRKPDPRPL